MRILTFQASVQYYVAIMGNIVAACVIVILHGKDLNVMFQKQNVRLGTVTEMEIVSTESAFAEKDGLDSFAIYVSFIFLRDPNF